MFTGNDLYLLQTAVPLYTGYKCSDIFSIEIFPGRIKISFGPGHEGRRTGSKMVSMLAEYLGMDPKGFEDAHSPKVGKDFVEMEYSK